jgi:hypothetical protein
LCTLKKWQHEERPAQTFGDFSEIRAAARDALGPFAYDAEGRPVTQYERPELPFWIERLDEIAAHDTVGLLRRRAFYEASVLRLRGLGSLSGRRSVYGFITPKCRSYKMPVTLKMRMCY